MTHDETPVIPDASIEVDDVGVVDQVRSVIHGPRRPYPLSDTRGGKGARTKE